MTDMRRASYRIVSQTPEIVFIEDLCGRPGHELSPSVTNVAEQVVEELLSRCGNKRIVYRDTIGDWDELVHNGKEFTNFAPWGSETPTTE